MKKIDYTTLIAFLLCISGMIRYFVLYINNKQTIDLVAFIIITIVFIALVSSYLIVEIIKKKQNLK
jgi:hypothetical protein